MSQHTDTSENTKATLQCYVQLSYVGLSSSVISSFPNSNMSRVEIPSLKMVCGCPYGVVIKNSDTSYHLTLWNAIVNVQLHILGDLQCSAGEVNNKVCMCIYIYLDRKARLSGTPVHRTVQEGLSMVSCRERITKSEYVFQWKLFFNLQM